MNQLIREVTGSLETLYEYDKRGNMIAQRKGLDSPVTYTYDATNMMTRRSEGASRTQYQYNGLRSRVGVTKHNGMKETERISHLVDATRPYNNLLGRETAKGTEQYVWAGDDLLASSGLGYFVSDYLGTPHRLVGGRGETADSLAVDAFGVPLSGRSAGLHPFGFTGYQVEDGGAYFAQARFYQPALGRFQAKDPILGYMLSPKSFNRYGYCVSNPVIFSDRTGKMPRFINNGITAVKNFWDTYIYGTEVEYLYSYSSPTDGTVGSYYTYESEKVYKDPVHTGEIIVIKETIENNEVVKTSLSLNISSIDLGNNNSIGIPTTVEFSIGDGEFAATTELGIDLGKVKLRGEAEGGWGEGGLTSTLKQGIGYSDSIFGYGFSTESKILGNLKFFSYNEQVVECGNASLTQMVESGFYAKTGLLYLVASIGGIGIEGAVAVLGALGGIGGGVAVPATIALLLMQNRNSGCSE